MTNNDILRRLRHALNINDSMVAEMIGKTGQDASRSQVNRWLKREEEGGYEALSDTTLCRFLDGLIIKKRGPRPDGSVPDPEALLSNNEVLKKLRIALKLRDGDVIAVFKRAGFVVTKAELGSFFRKEGHHSYRTCPEQVLRKFIQGLGTKTE
jgi:uncharacterized protein YehS (DUF1456 family)